MTTNTPLIQQEFVRIDGLTTSIYRAGEPELPALLAVPGGPGLDAVTFLPGILSLTNTFHLVLMDPRGCGNTVHPDNGDYSLTAFARDVCALGRSLKTQHSRVAVLGHSFGALVALYALAHSDDIFDAGVIMNIFSHSAAWKAYLAKTGQQMHNPPLDVVENRFRCSDKTDHALRELCLGYIPLYFPEISLVRAKKIMQEWTYCIAPYMFACERILTHCDVRPLCSKITAPCLCLSGERDLVCPPEDAATLAALFPQATSQLIRNAGHFPFVTQGAPTCHAIRSWWSTL